MLFSRLFVGFLMQIVPFAFLSFYPFKNRCKFGNKKTILITAIIIVILGISFSIACILLLNTTNDIHTLFIGSNYIFMACLIPCFIWYFIAVDGTIQKKLFSFFFMVTVALTMTSIENVIDTWVDDGTDGLPYYGYSLITLFTLTAVVLPLMCMILKKLYLPVADSLSQKESKFLSITSIILFIFLSSSLIPLEYDRMHDSLVVHLYFVLLLSIFIVYYVSLRFLAISHEKFLTFQRMTNAEHSLQMLDEQYNSIQNKIEASRKIRHDIRHNYVALQGLLEENDIAGAKKYLINNIDKMKNNSIPSLCDNVIINSIVGYYLQQAKENQVKLNTNINLSKKLIIKDEDIAVLLGNLLENAMTAAVKAEEDNRFIILNILESGNMLVIAIDNGFNGQVNKNDNNYTSTKEKHFGYGIISIKDIAEKYDGGAEFTNDQKVFHASVMLNNGKL